MTKNFKGAKSDSQNFLGAPPLELLLFVASPIENSKIYWGGGGRAPQSEANKTLRRQVPSKCINGLPMYLVCNLLS